MRNKFSHLDEDGNARMVDVSGKAESTRKAIAEAYVYMSQAVLAEIEAGRVKKGGVLSVAQLAGIMGGKKTAELIPLCHPLALESLQVTVQTDAAKSAVKITAEAEISGKTGVEMEALTAVAVAALTVYDMCKSYDKSMRIGDIRLLEKSGGKSGTYRARDE